MLNTVGVCMSVPRYLSWYTKKLSFCLFRVICCIHWRTSNIGLTQHPFPAGLVLTSVHSVSYVVYIIRTTKSSLDTTSMSTLSSRTSFNSRSSLTFMSYTSQEHHQILAWHNVQVQQDQSKVAEVQSNHLPNACYNNSPGLRGLM